MKSAKAPAGYVTEIEITVTLRDGGPMDFAWTTPIAVLPALHKALGWAKDDMRREGIRGRSRIVGVSIRASYVLGHYDEGGTDAVSEEG